MLFRSSPFVSSICTKVFSLFSFRITLFHRKKPFFQYVCYSNAKFFLFLLLQKCKSKNRYRLLQFRYIYLSKLFFNPFSYFTSSNTLNNTFLNHFFHNPLHFPFRTLQYYSNLGLRYMRILYYH